jgi:hypothetical protein
MAALPATSTPFTLSGPGRSQEPAAYVPAWTPRSRRDPRRSIGLHPSFPQVSVSSRRPRRASLRHYVPRARRTRLRYCSSLRRLFRLASSSFRGQVPYQANHAPNGSALPTPNARLLPCAVDGVRVSRTLFFHCSRLAAVITRTRRVSSRRDADLRLGIRNLPGPKILSLPPTIQAATRTLDRRTSRDGLDESRYPRTGHRSTRWNCRLEG